tara:strand:- start:864 stop:1361 length:498 start_codon:yes stop_codon:yes gene_type:complete
MAPQPMMMQQQPMMMQQPGMMPMQPQMQTGMMMPMQQPGMQNTTSTTTTTNITNIVQAAPKSPRSDRSHSPRSEREEPAEEEAKGMSTTIKALICIGCLVLVAVILVAWNFTQAAILLEPFRITFSKRYEPMVVSFFKLAKQTTAERGWTDGFQCKAAYPDRKTG